MLARELVSGDRYSFIGLSHYDHVNATFVRYEETEAGVLLHIQTEQREFAAIPLSGSGTARYEVIVHDRQEFYILIGIEFIIETFPSRKSAQNYLAEHNELIWQLNGGHGVGSIPEVCDRDHLNEVISEILLNGDGETFRPKVIDYLNLVAEYSVTQ